MAITQEMREKSRLAIAEKTEQRRRSKIVVDDFTIERDDFNFIVTHPNISDPWYYPHLKDALIGVLHGLIERKVSASHVRDAQAILKRIAEAEASVVAALGGKLEL